MPRTGLSKEEILQKSIELANQKGLGYLSVTTLSENLGIKKPSLYYHVQTVDEMIQWIMIYGWQKVSTEIVAKAENENPETSMKNYARFFYKFAKENPGVFEAMLWYNRYSSEELKKSTEGLYKFFFEQTGKMGISLENANHLLRTFRAFLEGFILLVAHNSFGNPIKIEESFEISLQVLIEGMKQFCVKQQNE